MFTINKDENGYILSISHTANDSADIDLDLIDLKYLNAYKWINSEVILDEVKKAELIAAEQKEAVDAEIADLKAKLKESDYVVANTFEQVMSLDNAVTFIVDFIKIMKDFKEKYSDLITDRKAWRTRIEELEK